MDVTIRDAVLTDAQRLLEIYGYYIQNTAITFEYEVPTTECFAQRMGRIMEHYPYLVAEADGTVMGYAYAAALIPRAACDWACEVSVYIDRTARKCGLGRRLYEALEAKLKAMGIVNLYASIAWPHPEDEYLTCNSAQFHAHMGFTQVGRLHNCGHKFGRWYDLLWVEKNIGSYLPVMPPLRDYPAAGPAEL